ncbi:helix-turn-helix domain-containing protein [Rhodococcus ruber]|uniref:helix-turn-helix domain-containing protein n=1 Tax=Rhodococcus ruber TaxID=1830 RepID=UPI003783DEC6
MTTRHHPPLGATVAATAAAVAAVAVAATGFWRSFTALADLATAYGVPPSQAWTLPIAVDGLVVAATVAAAARHNARWYAWALLVAGTVASVAGNGIHAWLITTSPIGVGIAVLPPLVTLAAVHLAILMARQQRDTTVAATTIDRDPTVEPVRDTTPTIPAPRPVSVLHVAPPAVTCDTPARPTAVAPTPAAPAAPAATATKPAGATVDDDTRTEALRLIASGQSIRAVGEHLGVSKDRVHRWVKAHRDTATAAAS